ncbi:molybdopterin-dependent oxidoreductase [Melioribacteraceae bacterium 4301-Me]|uniref:molybdopterin-containing oxidoreductase family protein n=1 Tax=Pyranulibacter aquaticus TaxID=3163344 RepID=UPI003595DB8F
MELSRRKFLKLTGFTIGAAAAAGAMNPLVKGAKRIDTKFNKVEKGIRKVPTYCSMCFWKCSAIAYVRDGQLWKIEGNPEDPLSNGRLCPRGTGGVGAHYDPDRLRAPLIRKKQRGEEKWVEVTWEEALSFVADKMKKIKSDYGPESIGLFSHGIGGGFIKHLLKAYGTNNIAAPSFDQCLGPRDVGFELTFGDVVGGPERTDIENSRCLVLIGTHLGENMHNTQVQEFAKAIENGATIIVVDPRLSTAASKAKYYLPIKPGTDIALLLTWINILISENLYDKEYIDRYAFGFEQLKAEVSQYTPEWAYPITGIEPELIKATAREMGKNKPNTLVHPGRHSVWYGDDTQRARALAILNALLGSWGRKGGLTNQDVFYIPPYPYPPYPKPQKENADNPNKKYPFGGEEGYTTGLREATITGKPYPIKGWFVYGTNLIYSLPNTEETVKAIQNLDLLVVIDVIPSEIAGWADVVLPEAIYLERYDELFAPYYKQPFVSLRQPVVGPPADQKPGWWIAKKLGEKLGLHEYFKWKDIEEYLDTRLKMAGLSLAELKKKGVVKGQKIPLYIEEGFKPEFNTPTGKIELYSTQLAKLGYDPIPKFTKHPEPPAGYFRLLFGRAPMHSFSRTQTNPTLNNVMSENEVWINSDIAKRLGIKSGDYVKLKNIDGVVSNKIKVKATERIRTDSIFLVHGFGHNSKMLKHAYLKGASDSQLITNYKIDPLMGGTAMNVNFVTIETEV